MKKLMIDETTGKITGYSDVNVLLPIYKEDVLVEDNEISMGDIIENRSFYIDGKIVKKEETEDEMKTLRERFEKKTVLDESKLFMDAILEGKDMEEARELVKKHRAELEELKEQIKLLEAEKEARMYEYWKEKYREADEKIDYQYYSAIAMVIKDENRYLKEWLDWHLEKGFDQIYLYDNGSHERVTEIVERYPEDVKEKITVVDWQNWHQNIQQDAYNDLLDRCRGIVRWVLFLDSDEFLRLEGAENVNSVLELYEDYAEVYGYMENHTANGLESYTDAPVRERFPETTLVDDGVYFKNFIQVNRVDSMVRHYARYDPKRHQMYRSANDNKELFVIEHYYTKSWEEWKEKILERGSVDPHYVRGMQEFFRWNPDMKYLDDGTDIKQKYQEDCKGMLNEDLASFYDPGIIGQEPMLTTREINFHRLKFKEEK